MQATVAQTAEGRGVSHGSGLQFTADFLVTHVLSHSDRCHGYLGIRTFSSRSRLLLRVTSLEGQRALMNEWCAEPRDLCFELAQFLPQGHKPLPP